MNEPIYTVEWKYRANEGSKADRFGPYLLQAMLTRSCPGLAGKTKYDTFRLGVVSLECINEVSHRHAFWVITEAALQALALDTEMYERISAELSRVVPLPSEGEIIDYRSALDALSRALRKQ
jgi:hypothetical protein